MHPQTLSPHRIQLHYAIQFIAATGMALGEAQPDGSQMTLTWAENLHGFVGQKIPATQIQVALFPKALASAILNQHQVVATLPLVGQTLATALAWHRSELTKLGVTADTLTLLDYPPDDFPDHPLAHGATFEMGGSAGREALAAYYAQTRPLLDAIVAANPAASPTYIWPHHFDMATLLTYPGATEAETKYLGVGFSPGDGSYAEPYWYITPYPAPERAQLPELPGGGWHTDHWVGAVLSASQAADVAAFIEEAVAVSKELLHVA
ncbi:MAG: hypothetical protein ACFCVD_07250 [Nodosilinea sp.]